MDMKFERDSAQSLGWLILFGIAILEIWACQTGHVVYGILLAFAGLFVGALLMWDFRVVSRRFHFAITKEGFEFQRHGKIYYDDIIYLWPWKRKALFPSIIGNKKWYSHSFLACYRTLKELDEEWENFIKAYNKDSGEL